MLRSQVVVQDEEIWTQKLSKNHKYILATATLNCLIMDINPKLIIDCPNRDIMACMRSSVSDLQYTMLTNLLHFLGMNIRLLLHIIMRAECYGGH